ncbi:hypothetical protein [Bacillus sp. JCM 19041]|uniref:hypothetical protein n=1 Tax=Bacillus sp. JCM 19041 TaxID=1460637 RepID=UPI0006D0E73B
MIGRDFVLLTTFKEQIWLPYHSIENAKVPLDIPDVSNAHQHFIFDDDLRTKLTTRFGETVAHRKLLAELFYEQTLYTQIQNYLAHGLPCIRHNKK